MNAEDDIVVESQFFSGENFKSHKYQMKFDVPGWDRGKYIGCITDELCEFRASQYIRKHATCMNTYCGNYLNIYEAEVGNGLLDRVPDCAGCGCSLMSFENKADIPTKIIAGQDRVSHRF